MKKVLIITLCALLCCTFLNTTNSVAKTKYTKVKTTTIKKYKKQIKFYKSETEKYKGIMNWLYNTLVNKCGYKYNKTTKTWSCTGTESITCLNCKTQFAHQPKGEAKYKYCPRCGSDNLDN